MTRTTRTRKTGTETTGPRTVGSTTTALLILSSLCATFLLISCSEPETGPAIGTPEWFWVAANETNAGGDYEKTADHLENAADSEHPWQERAAIWRFVLLDGLARGYSELADGYMDGVQKNNRNASALQNSIQQYQRDARRHTINLVESLGTARKMMGKAESIQFDFPLAVGSAAESPALGRVLGGNVPNESQAADAETQTVERGIILAAAAAIGAGDDSAKTRKLFETPPVEVAANIFFLNVATALLDRSEVFDREHLNEPDKRAVMLKLSGDFSVPALEGEDEELKKQAEELQEKLTEAKKPVRVRR